MTDIKIEDHEKLVRESTSKAILNTDIDSLTQYRRQRNTLKSNLEMGKKITQLEEDVSIIKDLLLKLLEGQK
jgi:hypothetical protein